MGIYKVEVFCPRRVRVVSVVKRDPNENVDGEGGSTTEQTAAGSTDEGGPLQPPSRQGSLLSSQASDGSYHSSTNRQQAPPATTNSAAPADLPKLFPLAPTPPSTTEDQATSSPALSTTDSTGQLPPSTSGGGGEEMIVAQKEHVDETGEVSHVAVTYQVEEIPPEDDVKAREEAKQQAAFAADDDATMGEGDCDGDNNSIAGSPQNTFPRKGVTFKPTTAADESPAPYAESDANGEDVDDEETNDINVEEELRTLLMELLPGVRVTWNRCNSLRNVNTDSLDNMSVSFVEVAFYCKRRTAMHVASRILDEIGIGKDFGRISVFPVEFFRPLLHNQVKRQQAAAERHDRVTTDISSMLQFDDLVENVDRGARLTFDFAAFLFISTIIAGAGLGSNSAVSTVASMLVSPMMGPILATVLGTVLIAKTHETTSEKTRRIAKRLLLNGFVLEFFCLAVCVAVGVLVGLAFWNDRDSYDWGEDGNNEMKSRTSSSGLVIGVVVAIPSGAGVALSLLGKNGNSLVGVAISASLLPPAVNCGMYLAFGLMKGSSRLAEMGATSLALTLINVVCIYVSALGTFYLKHALPQRDFDGRQLKQGSGTFFGVDQFDMAATGSIPGRGEEETTLAKARLQQWSTSPMPLRRQFSVMDFSSLERDTMFGVGSGSSSARRGHEPYGIPSAVHHQRSGSMPHIAAGRCATQATMPPRATSLNDMLRFNSDLLFDDDIDATSSSSDDGGGAFDIMMQRGHSTIVDIGSGSGEAVAAADTFMVPIIHHRRTKSSGF